MFRMSLNPFKCAIACKRKKLIGNVVSTEGISLDADKIATIQSVSASTTLKALQRFNGQIKWHSRHLRYLADIMAPLSDLTKKDADFI